MKKLLSILLLFGFSQGLYSQIENIQFTNKRPLTENRYADIKGSPYLFAGWSPGLIFSNTMEKFQDLEININGYTQEIEVKKDRFYIELDAQWYLRIEVEDQAQKRIFQRDLHPRFANKFVELVYQGKQLWVVKEFVVKLAEEKTTNIAGTRLDRQFVAKFIYYLIEGGELQVLPLKEKKILKLLNQSRLDHFFKEHKIQAKKESDLKKLMAYYEKSKYGE